MKFSNKVAIVTGSSNGIGQATAVLLAAEGASVTIHGRSEDGLKKTKELMLEKGVDSDRILLVQGEIEKDETISDLIQKTIEKFGKIDVLVNNAGVAVVIELESESMENYEYLHSVNVKSIIKLNRSAEPHLAKTKGNIVNVGSITSIMPKPTLLYYAMAKASLDHYTRSRTHELAKNGIRINNVNPGLIKTNCFAASGMTADEEKRFFENVEENIPMGRAGKSEEIAKVIAFLASDDASYVTGAIVVADGGLLQRADI